ncbi:MAG: hypothetical protein Q4G25_07475 [Paracoccus sp. (in: a-proteobacteria)]|nr:hypothetical protein [Paracoccus sp. (in: a-proteobacteria)]
MIGSHRDGWKWAQASGLSLALHGLALGWLIWQPGLGFIAPDPARPLAQIEITALAPAPEAPQIPSETLASAPQDPAAETGPGDDVITSDPPDEASLANNAPPDAPIETTPPDAALQTTDAEVIGAVPDSLSPVLTPEGPSDAGNPPPGTAASEQSLPVQRTMPADPPDPRLILLVERIRERLTEPCMLALPMMAGGDEVQLNVLSDSDRNITALMDSLTAGIDGNIGRRAVLLDSRQCAAAAFARRDPLYPVYGLGLQLDAQTVPSGQSLRGQITNAAGYYTTLLLVDENGVVHDLRRFLLSSAQVTRFDAPIARPGRARDTHQLLIALATPARPTTIAAHSGELAAPFFDALFAEIGQNALIGVSSIYVQ